jgi:hypothetical protein
MKELFFETREDEISFYYMKSRRKSWYFIYSHGATYNEERAGQKDQKTTRKDKTRRG